MQKIKKYFFFFLLGIILTLSHRAWFLPGIITGGDWGYNQLATVKEYFSLPYLWRTSAEFGSFNTSLYFYPWELVMGALSRIGLGYDVSFRLIFLWPIALLGGFSMYYLTRHFFKSKIVSFFAALFFSLNMHILLMDNGLLLGAMVYALFPLTFYFFHRAITSQSLKKHVLSGMVIALNFPFEPRFSYLVCGVLVFWMIFYSLYQQNIIKDLKKRILQLVVIFSPTVLLLAFWAVPLFFASGLNETTQLLDTSPLGTRFNTLMSLFFSHPDWTGGLPTIGQEFPPKFYLFIFPFLAFFTFMQKKKKLFTLFLGVLAVGSIFFFNGGALPFTGLYNFIFNYFPFFNVFRDSSKFYLIIGFSYAILIGLSLQTIYSSLSHMRWKYKRILKFLPLALVLIIILYVAKPAFLAGIKGVDAFKNTYIGLKQPEEFSKFNDFVLSQQGFFRVFSIPSLERFLVATNDKALVGAEQVNSGMPQFHDSQTFLQESNNIQYINNPVGFKNFLDITGEKYITLPFGLIQETYPFADKAFYSSRINSIPTLKQLPMFKSLSVFENNDAFPLFYTSNNYMYVSKSSLGNWALNHLDTQNRQAMIFFDKDGWNSKHEGKYEKVLINNPSTQVEIAGQITSYRSNTASSDVSSPQRLEDVDFSYARWLPTSPVYPFIRWEEDRRANSLQSDTNQFIEYELALSNKRLLEVNLLLQEGDIKPLPSLYKDYLAEIQQARSRVDDKNDNYLNVLQTFDKYFRLHRQVIKEQLTQINDAKVNKDIASTMNQIFAMFSLFGLSDFPVVPNHEWSNFYFYIPTSGTYTLNIILPSHPEEFSASFSDIDTQIDGQSISHQLGRNNNDELSLDKIKLTSGNHFISLALPTSRNFLLLRATDSAMGNQIFDLSGNGNQSPTLFSTQNLSVGNKYNISFYYRNFVNANTCFFIGQDTDKSGISTHCDELDPKHSVEISLSSTPYWQYFSTKFIPRWNTKQINIGFDNNYSLNTDPALSIKDITITRVWNPEIYLHLEKDMRVDSILPPVFFTKNNPTQFTVTLKKSGHPFVLVFNQAFNSDWKLYDSANREISRNNHLVINGIFNGWYITPNVFDTSETKTFTIVFSTQKFADIGFTISIIALLLCLLYLFFGKDKKL